MVSWLKKDEQFARIPTDWLLRSSPSPDVRTYIDIPRKSGLLTPEELRITEQYDATALADAIRRKELKCVDVTRAFCKVYALALHAPCATADARYREPQLLTNSPIASQRSSSRMLWPGLRNSMRILPLESRLLVPCTAFPSP
jgi:hypothetical protein